MTVAAAYTPVQISLTGGQTVVTVPFEFEFAADLLVLRAGNLLSLTTDYSVTGAGLPTGGSITLVLAGTAGERLDIYRNASLVQPFDLVPNDPFPATEFEEAFDRLILQLQQLGEELERRPSLARSQTLRNLGIPVVANGLIGWNSTATALITSPATILQVTPDAVSGLAYVKTVTTVNSSAGVNFLTATSAFPAGSEALYAVASVSTAFGTSNGLANVSIGDPDEGFDYWADSMGITLAAVSTVGQHQSNVPRLFNNAARDVIIGAIGGSFDATGQIKITTISATATPDA
jgi:hypothetical protein